MNAPNPLLRAYPLNSAEAAARIVALALIANGRIETVETAALDALKARERLGLTRQQWHGVIHDLCADLLGPTRCGNKVRIPSELLDRMLDEVVDDGMRRLVLRLCTAVAQADCQIDDGERFVLMAAIDRWSLHPDDHDLLEPMLYGSDFQVHSRAHPETTAPRE
ncbi:TerB family tellurite resistance protein [Hydrogenophaga sp. 2FB]|uniref:TerB family tellurite resistance protein n=1 Tax=Hydrogenophaga sp. 2FB TaxID=2502187 RepID=UPI0010F544BE|nr:TerB family tellurite resistance protein [Hydrogenophaga sp. 2FB]MDP3811704.1 TerB family tellurite resistance protein [Hydrogenophaga sp.]